MPRRTLDSLAISIFCENLAMMFSAGIPSDEAMRLLGTDAESGPFSDAAYDVCSRIDEGKTLAAAMEESGYFPSYATHVVKVGEMAGRTESSLRALATYYSDQSRLEEKLKSAVVYPTVLLFLMAAILLVMVIAVLPVFSGVYGKLSGDIASSAYSYITIATVICWASLVVTLLLACTILAIGLVAKSSSRGEKAVFRLLEAFPVSRGAMLQVACAQFTSILNTFIASGLDPDDAMDRAARTVENPRFAVKVEVCQERMREGGSLAQVFYDEKLVEPLYARMLISGARSGKFEDVLQHLSSLFYEAANERMGRLVNMIEPVLAGFLTIAVGFALISVMLPLIGIMGSIG
ncbi:MAG: type II secretion system F family protein [Actinobacteria bacterium]|nr:type II secretion system F family protein [Actinomycetota bacterium]